MQDWHAQARQQALLFTRGARLGWTFRDRRELITGYPEPRPDLPELERRAAARAEQADRRYAYTRRWLGLPSAVIGIILVVLAGCAKAVNPGAESGLVFAYTVVVCGPGLTATAWSWYRRAQAKIADPKLEYEHESERWRLRAAEHERAELARLARIPQWSSAEPPARRTDVFGGSLAGWQALLTIHGASILAERPLLVMDLSAQYAAAELVRTAREAGVQQATWVLPRDLDRCGLLARLTPTQLADAIAEAIHAGAPASARPDRAVDARVLGRLTGVLTGGITPSRLAAAAQVALGHRLPPGVLNGRELDYLAGDLFPRAYRLQITPNLVRLEAFLSDLAMHSGGGAGTAREPGYLTCLAVEATARSARAEMLTALVIQWLTARVAAAPADVPAVIVAGADEISRPHLERLAGTCEHRGVPLTILYRHLREDAAALIGGGAVAFMRLGNHVEAEQAATYLGRQHTFTLSTAHRGYEFAVEPAVLQNLPEYALLLAARRPGEPGPTAVEYDPAIVTLPGVSARPLKPPRLTMAEYSPVIRGRQADGHGPDGRTYGANRQGPG